MKTPTTMLLWLVMAVAAATASSVEVTSKPTHVTVFRDAAQVTRQATAELEEGEHVLVFGRLPPTVDHRTVQVSASSGAKATLKGVQVQQRPLPRPDTSAEVARLEERKRAYDAVLRELRDEIARHNGHKALLQRMAAKFEQCGKEPEEISIERWEAFIGFVTRSHATADAALRLAAEYQSGNQTALDAILLGLQRLREQNARPLVTEHTANVIVVMERAGAVHLNLSYVVSDASWQPTYDLRVDQRPEQKAVTVELNAIVQQLTGEDWEEVTLELSTASPSRQGVQPEMHPIRLKLHEPVVHTATASSASFYQTQRKMARMSRSVHANNQQFPTFDSGIAEKEVSAADIELAAEVAMDMASAAVSTQATTVSFTVAGRHTILGGSEASPYASYTTRTQQQQQEGGGQAKRPEPVRVPVAQEVLPATFRYSAVPKLEERAYLKAKLTAPKGYPLLAGPASVFTDHNRFTASTSIEFVPAGEDFWVFLGADDDVRVSHKLLKRVEQDESGGFLSGKTRRRVEYRYLIEVRNGKATKEEVVVWDQLPVSEDKDITVEVTEHGDRTIPMKRNEVEFVEWMLNLNPKEAKKIPFTFHVEYPKDKWITGLP